MIKLRSKRIHSDFEKKTTEARQNFTTYVRVKEQLERRKKRLNYRLKLTGEFSKKIVLQTEKLDSKAQWFFFQKF